MKRSLWVVLAAVAVFASTQAQAQFANRSITAGFGFLDMDDTAGFEWAVPLTIGYTGYIDSGFEYAFNVGGMILSLPNAGQVTGAQVGSGFRYLFLEETLRPYAGVDLNYLHIFFSDIGIGYSANYIGIGPFAGVDYFVGNTVSVGIKAQFSVYWWLNQRIQTTRGAYLQFGFWF